MGLARRSGRNRHGSPALNRQFGQFGQINTLRLRFIHPLQSHYVQSDNPNFGNVAPRLVLGDSPRRVEHLELESVILSKLSVCPDADRLSS